MDKIKYKVYPYRWVILLCMIPVLTMTNVFWLTFAPITGMAESFYNVSPLSIAFLSMSYMIVYIITALPASYVVDTKGFRMSIGIGAVITAVFGMLRGIYASNFVIVTICQLCIAVGQPFLVNSITKAAAKWFPVYERATASGIATMAGYIGMVIALILTPILTENYGMEKMLIIYGFAAIVCAFIFILFSREEPLTPPGPSEQLVTKINFSDIKNLLHKKNFSYLMICMFIIMGIFNAVMTWIEDIVSPRGISSARAGLIGGILVIVGLIGAVVLPIISDKIRKRRPLLVWPVIAAVPGFIGAAFSSNYGVIMISAAIMGFFIMGMGPVAFQYGAETAYPVPEGTSYGLLMLMGQISGILFIYIMDALRIKASGAMTISMSIFIVLMLLAFLLARKLTESPFFIKNPSDSLDPSEVYKARKQVCDTGKHLLESGLVSGTWGNVSCRINDDFMAITPSGMDYDKLNPEDIPIVNMSDLSYKGRFKPSSEKILHTEIYKTRSEINACIHTHSANASTVAASHREVPPLLDDMAQIIGPSIRVAEYAVPGTKKLAKGALKALKGRNGVLLANHGAVCIGRNVDEAFTACEILEKACKTFIESEFLGGGVPINKFEAKVMHEYFLKKYSKQKIKG